MRRLPNVSTEMNDVVHHLRVAGIEDDARGIAVLEADVQLDTVNF
jgi:hypothetical protein